MIQLNLTPERYEQLLMLLEHITINSEYYPTTKRVSENLLTEIGGQGLPTKSKNVLEKV